MINIQHKHTEAMKLAQRAELKRVNGDRAQFRSLSRKAFHLEKEAASLVAPHLELEPTRSILHRSAAALALDCDEYREAERLCAAGLAGEPPEEIADELREILEQANFHRHLRVTGKVLSPIEMQMSIVGGVVGHGYASSREVMDRVSTTKSMMMRTIDRLAMRAFDDKRGAVSEVTHDIYLSTPRASSFAISIQLVAPAQQDFTIKKADQIIDEVMTCCELYSRGTVEALRERMQDAYLTNFIGLARRLEPDGANVTFVGLTAQQGKNLRTVSLTRRAPIMEPTVAAPDRTDQSDPGSADGDPVEVFGILKAADSRSEKHSKIIVREFRTEKDQPFTVPKGMMADIVRPLYELEVVARGTRKGKGAILDFIAKAPRPT